MGEEGGISKDSQYVHGLCGGASVWISGPGLKISLSPLAAVVEPRAAAGGGHARAAFVCDDERSAARHGWNRCHVSPRKRENRAKQPLHVDGERNVLKCVDKTRNK